MEDGIKLVDLVEVDILQRIQDVFCNMTGMAAQCSDENGNSITEGSGFTEFCKNNIRCTTNGKMMCRQCAKYAGERTREDGKSIPYICHAGVFDFSAPIIVDGKYLGVFSGGQVLVDPMDKDRVYEIADELGLDQSKLWADAQKLPIVTRKAMAKAAEDIYVQAGIISDLAYGKYVNKKNNEDLVNSSSMKSDFLANMSHEIRTPMNAVIGMAEMALREDMSAVAKDYIGQIKNSGKALLNIINDILDYSKIESGKMELSCVEYEPLSLINDVASIIMTRLTDKPVELLLDVDPNVPHTLYGDDLRIRQILINLANNATKFTNHGHVQLKVRYKLVAEDMISLQVSVIDTGIGIRKEDMKKLFNSFQQIDSKRNRNVEGTGLGLAITQRLIGLMGGEIHIESEYEVGSTFSFEIPQKIVENIPSIALKNPGQYAMAGFFSREDVADDYVSDAGKLKVNAFDLSGSIEPKESIKAWCKLHQKEDTHVIVDEKTLESGFEECLQEILDSVNGVILLAEPFSDVKKWNNMPFLHIIKKPFSVLNLAGYLEEDSCRFGHISATDTEFNYIAPKAKVLVVDDNAINLTVAEGLLEPLKMLVDTAKSGREALEKIDTTHYDIIFMDHMMPEMDGVETTRIIRRLHPECADVPIIALTANAISGTKEMFLSEGMNDFIAKPIEVRILVSKVRQWLPSEKIMNISMADATMAEAESTEALPDRIGDLDIKAAVGLLGSEKLFWKVLKDYYRVITSKADLIQKYFDEKDWVNYVVEVHALKSASKQIGANTLSALAAEMEAAGNSREVVKIHKRTDEMLLMYRAYIPVLAPFFREKEDDSSKAAISDKELEALFKRMLEAIDNLDIVEMGNVVEEMNAFSYSEDKKEKFTKLKNAVSDIDVDACEDIVNNWFS